MVADLHNYAYKTCMIILSLSNTAILKWHA